MIHKIYNEADKLLRAMVNLEDRLVAGAISQELYNQWADKLTRIARKIVVSFVSISITTDYISEATQERLQLEREF